LNGDGPGRLDSSHLHQACRRHLSICLITFAGTLFSRARLGLLSCSFNWLRWQCLRHASTCDATAPRRAYAPHIDTHTDTRLRTPSSKHRHTHSHIDTHTQTHTHTHTHTNTHAHRHTDTDTHPHGRRTHTTFSLSLIHSLPRSHSLTHSVTQTHPHTHSLMKTPAASRQDAAPHVPHPATVGTISHRGDTEY
jgi:hypothetical protein